MDLTITIPDHELQRLLPTDRAALLTTETAHDAIRHNVEKYLEGVAYFEIPLTQQLVQAVISVLPVRRKTIDRGGYATIWKVPKEA
jgi:hypothetical protein